MGQDASAVSVRAVHPCRHVHVADGPDGIRQYWHVWQVMQDTSAYAATPALGYASKMISLCVLVFLSLVAFVFWLGGLAEKSTFVAAAPGVSPGTRGAQHVGH